MSGTYRRLRPGRYQLLVDSGAGPAGIRRPGGKDVAVDVDGGALGFRVESPERVYYWWRGPRRPGGVRLLADQPPQLARPMRRTETGMALVGD